MGRFPLVHALSAALVDYTLGVAHDAVVMTRAHGFQQFQTGDAGSAGAVQDDAHVLDLLSRDFQRVQQAGRTDHRRAVLVVVEHRNVHQLFQALLDDEAFRRLDVLKVDAAKGWPHQPDRIDDLFRVLGVQLDVDGVHIGEALEEHRLALHHRLRGQRAQIAHAEDRGAVRDDRDHIALDGIVIGRLGLVGDGLHRHRHPRRIGQRQIPLRRHRGRGDDVVFPGPGLHVIGQRLFGCDPGPARGVVVAHRFPPALRPP